MIYENTPYQYLSINSNKIRKEIIRIRIYNIIALI